MVGLVGDPNESDLLLVAELQSLTSTIISLISDYCATSLYPVAMCFDPGQPFAALPDVTKAEDAHVRYTLTHFLVVIGSPNSLIGQAHIRSPYGSTQHHVTRWYLLPSPSDC